MLRGASWRLVRTTYHRAMSLPTLDLVREALARVDDPEIRKPITELGMVRDVVVAANDRETVTEDHTTQGCPLKETFSRDVTRDVGRVPGVVGVEVTMGVMDDAQRKA